VQIRAAVVGIIVGGVMALAVAAPASAANSSGNLLAAAGVTFGAPRVEHLKMVEPDTTAPSPAFAAALEGAFTPRQNEDKHTIGGGLRTGGYSYGIAGMLRFWMNERIFFDVSLGYHAAYFYLNHTVFSASVMYNIKTWDDFDEVILRLYAGGGIDILHWSVDRSAYPNGFTYDSTTLGGHGVAGVEVLLKQLRQLGFGAEAGFYSRNHDVSNTFSLPGWGGFGSGIYAIWYFK
jgi:hypothetical protein